MRMSVKDVNALLKKMGLPTVKGETFDSLAEAVYYVRYVQPLLLTGEIVNCDMHREFEILPKLVFQGKTYRARRFTPDFFLTYKDGHVKVVEVKSKYVRYAQRDYPLRRQLFLDKYCAPNSWEFEEVCADDLTKGKKVKK